jgi:homoserine kinase
MTGCNPSSAANAGVGYDTVGRLARPEEELRAVGLSHEGKHLRVDIEVEAGRRCVW